MTFTKFYNSKSRISTFDDVAAHYASVKPIVSKYHKAEDDIRPLHARRYKHERIIKIDDNNYALHDGWYDNLNISSNLVFPDDFVRANYAIVWSRDANGDTFIRVRNGSGNYGHTGRYMFLSAFLPRGMTFRGDSNGKQYVLTGGRGVPQTEYLLPKSMHTWDWNAQKPKLDEDDKMYLTFKVLPDNKYERAGELLTVKTKRVDIATKKALKPQTDAFYAWWCVICPMLARDLDAAKAAAETINEYQKREVFSSTWNPPNHITPEASAPFMREVLADEEHEMRSAVATIFAYYAIGISDYKRDETDPKNIRTRFNKLMQKMLNLYATTQV